MAETNLLSWLKAKPSQLKPHLSDVLAPCLLLPISIDDHLTIARTIQNSNELMRLFCSIETCSLTFLDRSNPRPTCPINHLYLTVSHINLNNFDLSSIRFNQVISAALGSDILLIDPLHLQIDAPQYLRTIVPLPTSRLPITITITLMPKPSTKKTSPLLILELKLHYLPRKIITIPDPSSIPPYDQYYEELLIHFLDPLVCPSDQIEWLLDEYGRRYGLSRSLQAEMHLKFLMAHPGTSRDHFEMLIFWLRQAAPNHLDKFSQPTLIAQLRTYLEAYLRRYELLGPWEPGALNAILRLVPWVTNNVSQFIVDAIQDGLRFSYTIFQMNEDQDMIPTDGSDCAILTQTVRKIGAAILKTASLHRSEFETYFDLTLITATYYYQMISQDLQAKLRPDLTISNELFDLYAEMKRLHSILFQCGLGKMEVLPLHDIFQPFLVRYILQIEPRFQEWIPKYLAVERTRSKATSAFDLFVAFAHATQVLERFKLNRSQFVTEYILFIEMVGRVIQAYLQQLEVETSLIQITSNLIEVQRQFKLLTQPMLSFDPRVGDLAEDIQISINRHWPSLLRRIVMEMRINEIQFSFNENLKSLMVALDDRLEEWACHLGHSEFVLLLWEVFEATLERLEALLAPTTDLQVNRKLRAEMASVCEAALPTLIKFFHGEANGPPLEQLEMGAQRLAMLCNLYRVEVSVLISMLDHSAEFSEAQIISILITKGKKILIPGSSQPRSWRKIIGAKRCRRYHLI